MLELLSEYLPKATVLKNHAVHFVVVGIACGAGGWELAESLYKNNVETLKTNVETLKTSIESDKRAEERAKNAETRLQREQVRADVQSGPVEPYVGLTSDDERGSEPSVKAMKLQIDDTKVKGEGTGSSDQSWSFSGYFNSGHLVLAYRSSEARKIGFGVYWLEGKNAEGTVYVGQVVGNHCVGRDHPVIMRCNAVVVRGVPGGDLERAARVKYKDYLAAACVDDHPVVNIPKESCD
jgi:hypothetical protein